MRGVRELRGVRECAPENCAAAPTCLRVSFLPTTKYIMPAVKSVFDCESTWYATAEMAESASKYNRLLNV